MQEKKKKSIKENAVRFEYAGEQKTINIHVIPMHVPQYDEPFFLLLFEDVTSAANLLRQNMELSYSSEGQEYARDRTKSRAQGRVGLNKAVFAENSRNSGSNKRRVENYNGGGTIEQRGITEHK